MQDQKAPFRIKSTHLFQVLVDSMLRLLLAIVLIQFGSGAANPLFNISSALAAENRAGSLPPQGLGIQVRGERISLDIRDVDIGVVLREISRKTTIDLTLGDGVTGKVSLKLTDVTIEDALKNLCQSSALVYEYLPDKNAYRIIQTVALTETMGQETSGGAGPVAKQTKPAVLSDKAKPGSRIAQGDPGTETKNAKKPVYKSGELLVRFKPGVTAQQMADLHRSFGSTVLGNITNLRLQRIKLREGLSEEAAMTIYGAADIVEHVEQHALRYPSMNPNDPNLSLQWGLPRIKASEAWDITQGRPDVIVAVLDTGVDYRHPDLQNNIWINTVELNGLTGVDDDGNGYIDDIRGWDFAGGDANPMDVYGHGTHVAGIIAAEGNNGLGIAGINWQAKIMALKVMADNDTSILDFAVIEATQYAIAKGARIINCSWGGESRSNEEESAFIALKNAGILAVCAAGNEGMNNDIAPNYPASYKLRNIVSVAASDGNDNLATFSNYGLTSVDVMAPGVDIYSTWPGGARILVGGANPAEYNAIGMTFAGITDPFGITGTAYDCGMGYPGQFPAGVRGNIAIIARGSLPDRPAFTFADKVRNAQTAGAIGVIIYNNTEGEISGTLGSNGAWVPVVSITKANGAALIAGGTPVPFVTLINNLLANPYQNDSGTSMAAPQVAGIAGLTLARCPSLGYADIKAAITNTVDKMPAVAGKMVSGGRVNAFAALTSMLLPGDLSGDCRIGLDDAILALQILSGLSPQFSCPACRKDVNGDSRIGLQEAIFVLQRLLFQRP